ncbi:UNKNOWN [Stylonychia lemnae]|uniref:Uncharacterized protein n=1 Tax=Stylonychia lemnae TaxID=5949 RepID=A0A078A9Y2_STYLE|nr:UNKNOWN [Stylonychia lemnae]|eukprot:CDW78706.1 UNKNOWN [Stylonychia lemnae]
MDQLSETSNYNIDEVLSADSKGTPNIQQNNIETQVSIMSPISLPENIYSPYEQNNNNKQVKTQQKTQKPNQDFFHKLLPQSYLGNQTQMQFIKGLKNVPQSMRMRLFNRQTVDTNNPAINQRKKRNKGSLPINESIKIKLPSISGYLKQSILPKQSAMLQDYFFMNKNATKLSQGIQSSNTKQIAKLLARGMKNINYNQQQLPSNMNQTRNNQSHFVNFNPQQYRSQNPSFERKSIIPINKTFDNFNSGLDTAQSRMFMSDLKDQSIGRTELIDQNSDEDLDKYSLSEIRNRYNESNNASMQKQSDQMRDNSLENIRIVQVQEFNHHNQQNMNEKYKSRMTTTATTNHESRQKVLEKRVLSLNSKEFIYRSFDQKTLASPQNYQMDFPGQNQVATQSRAIILNNLNVNSANQVANEKIRSFIQTWGPQLKIIQKFIKSNTKDQTSPAKQQDDHIQIQNQNQESRKNQHIQIELRISKPQTQQVQKRKKLCQDLKEKLHQNESLESFKSPHSIKLQNENIKLILQQLSSERETSKYHSESRNDGKQNSSSKNFLDHQITKQKQSNQHLQKMQRQYILNIQNQNYRTQMTDQNNTIDIDIQDLESPILNSSQLKPHLN